MRNFSLVSKMYYDGGGIPEEFVVKTCLMSGGKAKKTIERLYPLVKERSIFPLSSRRMLDLATGKLCEICKNVIKYDKNNSVSLVRDPYAIHACWSYHSVSTDAISQVRYRCRITVCCFWNLEDHNTIINENEFKASKSTKLTHRLCYFTRFNRRKHFFQRSAFCHGNSTKCASQLNYRSTR